MKESSSGRCESNQCGMAIRNDENMYILDTKSLGVAGENAVVNVLSVEEYEQVCKEVRAAGVLGPLAAERIFGTAYWEGRFDAAELSRFGLLILAGVACPGNHDGIVADVETIEGLHSPALVG